MPAGEQGGGRCFNEGWKNEVYYMPIIVTLDRAIFEWQVRHSQRMTYAELARQTGISLPTLYRMKSGEMNHPDLRKINAICKVLECQPGDLLVRVDTHHLEDPQGPEQGDADADSAT